VTACLSIFVPGIPLPAGSGDRLPVRCRCGKTWHAGPYLDNSDRATKTRKSGSLKRWKQAINGEAKVEMWARGTEAIEGPVSVELVFYMPAPKRRNARPAVKPDVDKLARAVLDGLTGSAFADDGQVVELKASKRYADLEHPRTGVQIEWGQA
jgi:Holliday junction resolvase RusA-like endonuclease